MFQSLTGSIHTVKIMTMGFKGEMFQSLTGSIHTKFLKKIKTGGLKVSIPHRFNSHNYKIFRCDRCKSGFNPSQVQFTLVFLFLWIFWFWVSIPHRFNSHKWRLTRNPEKDGGFNPSQVQFTQITGYSNVDVETKFQSLTGSIHTNLDPEGEYYDPSFQSLTGSIHTKKRGK